MTIIDWTQPVETTEDPPRPVWVLIDSEGVPCAVLIDGNTVQPMPIDNGDCVFESSNGETQFTLRNVPAKPVRHEGYVTICPSYPDAEHDFGKVASGPICKDGTALAACHPSLIVGRIVWNSPVEDDENAARMAKSEARYERLREERDHWKTEAKALSVNVKGLERDLLEAVRLTNARWAEEAVLFDLKTALDQLVKITDERDAWNAPPPHGSAYGARLPRRL